MSFNVFYFSVCSKASLYVGSAIEIEMNSSNHLFSYLTAKGGEGCWVTLSFIGWIFFILSCFILLCFTLLTLFNLILLYLFHFTLFYFIFTLFLLYFTLLYFILLYLILFYFILFYFILFYLYKEANKYENNWLNLYNLFIKS